MWHGAAYATPQAGTRPITHVLCVIDSRCAISSPRPPLTASPTTKLQNAGRPQQLWPEQLRQQQIRGSCPLELGPVDKGQTLRWRELCYTAKAAKDALTSKTLHDDADEHNQVFMLTSDHAGCAWLCMSMHYTQLNCALIISLMHARLSRRWGSNC